MEEKEENKVIDDFELNELPEKKPRSYSLNVQRILVGVAGGSASGKTTICTNIKKEIIYDGSFEVTIISLDSFYKGVDKTK